VYRSGAFWLFWGGGCEEFKEANGHIYSVVAKEIEANLFLKFVMLAFRSAKNYSNRPAFPVETKV
jgi:hypothetical protein